MSGRLGATAHRCPLCWTDGARPFYRERHRPYLRCERCWLTFIPAPWHLDPEAERARYDLHENDAEDFGYRAYLAPLVEALVGVLSPGARGLDFGCGPGPALPSMLEANGFQVALFDPFFAPDPRTLEHRYDFVACTETVEHFCRPDRSFAALDGLLKPGATLGIMTVVLTDEVRFPGWHYIQDPTHVAFYRPETLAWIAEHWGWTLDLQLPRVVLFRKGPG